VQLGDGRPNARGPTTYSEEGTEDVCDGGSVKRLPRGNPHGDRDTKQQSV